MSYKRVIRQAVKAAGVEEQVTVSSSGFEGAKATKRAGAAVRKVAKALRESGYSVVVRSNPAGETWANVGERLPAAASYDYCNPASVHHY